MGEAPFDLPLVPPASMIRSLPVVDPSDLGAGLVETVVLPSPTPGRRAHLCRQRERTRLG